MPEANAIELNGVKYRPPSRPVVVVCIDGSDPDYFAAAAPSAGSGLKRTEDFIDPAKIKDLPVWAFHGDKDGVCPIERDQKVFDEMKKLGGNMKFTIWHGDRHGVSSKMILGGENGTTRLSGDRCDKEPDFMTWLFAQSRKKGGK